MRGGSAARVFCAALCLLGSVVGQTPEASASRAVSRPASAPAATRETITPEGAAEKLLGDRPTLRKQATDWINAHPEQGVPALVKALLSPPHDRFTFDGIRATGGVKDARVGLALLQLLDAKGFRWRPQAFESLADLAPVEALPRFIDAVNEPVWRSRAAACRGLAALNAKNQSPLLVAMLEDEEAPVRLEAAVALWTFDDARGLPTVVHDLSLDRRFFDADHGALARDASARFLCRICGKNSFPVPHPPLDLMSLRGALAKVRSAVGDRGASFPDLVPPHDPDAVGFPYAVEYRSCVEGDFYLRFNDQGEIVVGRDRLLRITSNPDAVLRLKAILDGFDYGPRGKKVHGPVTCDFERIGAFSGGVWRTAIFGDKKRPADLDAFENSLAELVKTTLGMPAADVHSRRARRFGASP